MSGKEWTRTDYLEEDVRRNSEEIRALTKVSAELLGAVKGLTDVVEASKAPMEDHEERLRKLESWQARSGTYWTIAAFVIASIVGFIFNNIGGLFKFVT
jgi:hypothetical protein